MMWRQTVVLGLIVALDMVICGLIVGTLLSAVVWAALMLWNLWEVETWHGNCNRSAMVRDVE